MPGLKLVALIAAAAALLLAGPLAGQERSSRPGSSRSRETRELLEETGYRAESVERLGDVNPNPALFGNRLHLFLARDVVWEQAIQNSEREETSVELVPLREIPERVLAGEIDHALVVAALYWFEKRAAAAAT